MLRSGGAITASLVAPLVGQVIENDATIFTQYPTPDVPDSIRDEVLAEAEAVYQEILADRQALADFFAEFAQDVATARLEVADEIAEVRAEVSAAGNDAYFRAHASLDDDKARAIQLFYRLHRQAAAEIDQLWTAVNRIENELIQAVDRVQAMRNQAFQKALALVQESNRLLAQADREMASDEQGLRARSQQERMLRDVWYREALKTWVDRINEILTEVVDGIIEAHEIFWNDVITNPDYWRGVGHVFWGYGLSIVHSVQGVFHMIAHPVDTAQGVYQAVTHPGQTLNAIVSDIKEKLKTNRGTGELVGDGLLAVFTGGSIKLLKDAGYLARLKKFLPGSKTAGGRWYHVIENMSDRARAYQKQITGRSGQAYFVNGVKFDGIDAAGTLLEAKGPGYVDLLKNQEIQAKIGERLLKQATNQVEAAKGAAVKWVVAEKEFAEMLQGMFRRLKIPIEVVHEAMD